MTVGEIMDAQRGSLFAVGKYQIIPGTMKEFVQNMGISRDDVFNEETQDKFKEYTVNYKRPSVGKFLTGAAGSSLEKAQLALAAEFASVGVPYDMKKGEYNGEYPVIDIKKGDSLYKGARGKNAASISPETIAKALEKEKKLNSEGGDGGGDDDDKPEPKDWTKGMPDYGLSPQQSGSLNLGDGIFARRVKEGSEEKWRIYRPKPFGNQEINTTGKNEWLKPRLEEAGKKYLQSQSRASADGLIPPEADKSTALATKSTEIAMANVGGGATIINNTYVTGGQNGGGGNSPGSVPIGISSRDTGTSPFSDLSLRTIG